MDIFKLIIAILTAIMHILDGKEVKVNETKSDAQEIG